MTPNDAAARNDVDSPAPSVRVLHSSAAPSSSHVVSTTPFRSPEPICVQTLEKLVAVQASAAVEGTRRMLKFACPGHVWPPTAPESVMRRGTPLSEFAR